LSQEDLTQTDIGKRIMDCMLISVDMILTRMKQSRLMHGDLHFNNIGFQSTRTLTHTGVVEFVLAKNIVISPLLIDYGWSSVNVTAPSDVELIQTIRCLHPVLSPGIVRNNRTYMYNGLLALVDKHCVMLNSKQFAKSIFGITAKQTDKMDAMYYEWVTSDWRTDPEKTLAKAKRKFNPNWRRA
jgi:hypothetical protein